MAYCPPARYRPAPPATLAACTPVRPRIRYRWACAFPTCCSASATASPFACEQERADLPPGGVVHLALRTVLQRYIDLGFAATLINGGGRLAIATGTYIPADRPAGQPLLSPRHPLRWRLRCAAPASGARLGLVYWFSSRIGTVLEGLVQWTSLIPNRETRLHRACRRRDTGPASSTQRPPGPRWQKSQLPLWRRL